jgi:hypothetical protein
LGISSLKVSDKRLRKFYKRDIKTSCPMVLLEACKLIGAVMLIRNSLLIIILCQPYFYAFSGQIIGGTGSIRQSLSWRNILLTQMPTIESFDNTSPHVCFVVRTYSGHGHCPSSPGLLQRFLKSLTIQSNP